MKKKWELEKIEALSERAAFVYNSAKELQLIVPIPDKVIWAEYITPWSTGSEHIDLEVQVPLMEKSDAFNPSVHIPCLRKLVEAHYITGTPIPAPLLQQHALEVDEFQLLMKRMQYDVSAVQTWRKKCSNVMGAREHAEQEFKLKRRQRISEAVTVYLHSCCKLSVWNPERPEAVIADIISFKRESVAKRLGVPENKILKNKRKEKTKNKKQKKEARGVGQGHSLHHLRELDRSCFDAFFSPGSERPNSHLGPA